MDGADRKREAGRALCAEVARDAPAVALDVCVVSKGAVGADTVRSADFNGPASTEDFVSLSPLEALAARSVTPGSSDRTSLRACRTSTAASPAPDATALLCPLSFPGAPLVPLVKSTGMAGMGGVAELPRLRASPRGVRRAVVGAVAVMVLEDDVEREMEGRDARL